MIYSNPPNPTGVKQGSIPCLDILSNSLNLKDIIN